ncbi:MAG: VanZ family protein, partial [Thermoanaerobaculia bacterium]
MRSFIRYWLPVVLWASVILVASSDLFAATGTGGVLAAIVRTIIGRDLSPELFAALHLIIRKAAHLIEYAILGALALRAIRQQASWTWRHAAGAV